MTPWTVGRQALLSMGFPRQEYGSGLPFLSPGDLPDSGIEPVSSALKMNSLLSKPQGRDIATSVSYHPNKMGHTNILVFQYK